MFPGNASAAPCAIAARAPRSFRSNAIAPTAARAVPQGHAAMMGFVREAISVSGEPKEFHSKADSGTDVVRAFCPECGTEFIRGTQRCRT